MISVSPDELDLLHRRLRQPKQHQIGLARVYIEAFNSAVGIISEEVQQHGLRRGDDPQFEDTKGKLFSLPLNSCLVSL